MSKSNLIFFHNDVDGIFTAALFLNTYNSDIYRLYPLSSQMRGDKFNDAVKASPEDGRIIVLDYQHHERADFWVDHHFDSRFGPNEVSNQKIKYDPSSKSAFSILRKMAQESKLFNLSERVDMIDSSGYKNPEQIFLDTSPLMCIRAYLEKIIPNDMSYCRIAEIVSASNMDVERAAWIMKIGHGFVDSIRAEAQKIKDHIVISDGMSIVRQRRPMQFPRHAEYYVRPDVKYSVRLTKIDGNNAYLQVGYNKWHERPNQVNIGRAIAGIKEANKGGGHFHVGGAIIKESDAETVLDKLSIIFTEGVEAMEKYGVDGEDAVEKKAKEMVKTGSAKTMAEAREKSALETSVDDQAAGPDVGGANGV